MPVQTMKAVRFHEFGGPEVLRYEDAPKPGLKPGEVLVRVHAVGVNPPDWYLREGNKMLPPEWRPPIALPAIPGSDVSGVAHDIDLVLDTLGGSTTGRFIRTIKRGGALFPVFPLGFDGADDAAKHGVTVSATQVRSDGAQLAEIAKLLDAGIIRVAVDGSFPLDEARNAHERAAEGHIRGKIVLTVR